MYNGLQIVRKFFEALCMLLRVNYLMTTTYHFQIDGQAEHYNQTILSRSRSRHYLAENQRDWDLFVQPLTYAHISQVHNTPGMAPYSFVLSREPPKPSTFITWKALPYYAKSETLPKALRYRFLNRLSGILHNANKRMKAAQKHYKRHHDVQVREKTPL